MSDGHHHAPPPKVYKEPYMFEGGKQPKKRWNWELPLWFTSGAAGALLWNAGEFTYSKVCWMIFLVMAFWFICLFVTRLFETIPRPIVEESSHHDEHSHSTSHH